MKRRNKALLAGFIAASLVAASSFTAFAADMAVSNIEDMTVSEFGTNNTDSNRAANDTGHIYVGVAITDGAIDEANSNWADKATEEDGAFTVTLNDEVEGIGFTAVRDFGSTVTVTGDLKLHDDGDGTYDSDFTGMGTAVTGANGAEIYVKDVNFYSEGIVRSFGNITGSNMYVENSTLTALGANPFFDFYSDYVNTYNTAIMISPPWILGFQGAIRTINVLGVNSNLVIADSTVQSGGWAVLSTDGCTSPYYWIFNSTLETLPESEGGMNSGWKILGYDENAYGSGYAALAIGSAQEHFYGVTVNGSTFAAMSMGGDFVYQGIKAGETYEALAAADGSVIYTYTATEDKNTEINTVFGAQFQGAGSVAFNEGTVVNTASSTFVYRDSNVDFIANGAQLNPGNGIILQMMDNDNSTVGDGPIGQSFDHYFYEEAGFQTKASEVDASYIRTEDTTVNPDKTYYAEAGNNEYVEVENPEDAGTVAYYEKTSPGSFVTLSLSNGEYVGNVYNATGYYGQAPDALEVTIAEDASLNGDIALATHVHGIMLNGRNVDDVIAAIDEANAVHAQVEAGYYADMEDIQYVFLDAEGNVTENKDEAAAIQFTQFTSMEYYIIMQVVNKVHYNGASSINVIVNGTWKPADQSLITYLEIAEGAHVYGDLVNLGNGALMITPSDNEIEAGVYGDKFVYVEDPNGSSGGDSADAESADSEGGDAESADSEAAEGEAAEAPAADAAAESDSAESEGEAAEAPADATEAPAADAESDSAESEGEAAEAAAPAEGDAAAESDSAESEGEAAEAPADAAASEGESADSEAAPAEEAEVQE